jgi:PmbA protein
MARVAPEDHIAGLADARCWRTVSRSRSDRSRAAGRRGAGAHARAAEQAALSVKGVSKSGGASAAAGIGGMVLVTSHGFRGAYVASSHSISAMAIAGEGTGMERDYDYTSARHAGDLESIEKIGRSAGERAVKRLNPRKVETRRVPVVYDPRVAGSLVGHLASAINGASIARKTSFLRERMGERLFPKGIRIVDDPLRPRGLRSHPFDGEGVAGKELTVIEDGILQSWFLDSADPRANCRLTTTGHASRRGVVFAPSPSPTNLHLEAGPASPRDLIAAIKDGFYVTDLIGMAPIWSPATTAVARPGCGSKTANSLIR